MAGLDNVFELLDGKWRKVVGRHAEHGFDQLSHAEQVFAAIMELLIEVDNGGFAQYMFNDHGGHGLVAIAALREVGVEAAAAVCEEFFGMLPGERPAATKDERQGQLDCVSRRLGERAFEEMLDGLQKRFYSEEDELQEKLAEYAQKHLAI